jgi:hypothetical protein
MLTEPELAGADGLPTEDEDTLGFTVPDFFQEEDEPALRSQVEWVEQHLGFSDQFFTRFLLTPELSFRDWRLGETALPPDRKDSLRAFWRTVLHLLSFMGLDEQRVKTMLDHQVLVEASGPRRHPLAPPWTGSSLRSYLEGRGPDVLPDVDWWVTGFRFGNPYAS